MNIAVPKEVHEGETRVSMVPDHVAKLVRAGAEVSIESGLGRTLRIADEQYTMKIRSSLRSLRKRHRQNRLVRRKGRVYVINKTNRRFKARQA